MSVDIRIRAINLFNKGIKAAIWSVKKLGNVVKTVGRQMKRVAIAGAVGFVAMVRNANQFRIKMAEVGTMLGENRHMLEGMTKDVLKMAAKYGMSTDTLAKGLYDILSAGVPASEAMDVLRIATEAAVGGVTDTATSVDALTTILNAYTMQADQASHVSDILFQVVKDGKVTYGELADNVGKLAPIAKVAGLSMEDLGAVMATVLKVEKPERAMTAIRAAITKAAEDGKNLFELIDKFKGKDLEAIVRGGIDKRAAVGVAILANNYDLLQKEIGKFKNVTGAAKGAFDQMNKVRHWSKTWQSFLYVVKSVGMEFDKVLAPIAERIAKKFQNIGDNNLFDGWAKAMANTLKDVETIITAIAGGGTTGKAAWEGLKKWGADMAHEAGVRLLAYAPYIGDAIGKAAKAAIKGGKAWQARRVKAAEQMVSEGAADRGAALGLGVHGFGPHGAEISRRAEIIKQQELAAQSSNILEGRKSGEKGWDELVAAIEKLAKDTGKAVADNLKEEK